MVKQPRVNLQSAEKRGSSTKRYEKMFRKLAPIVVKAELRQRGRQKSAPELVIPAPGRVRALVQVSSQK